MMKKGKSERAYTWAEVRAQQKWGSSFLITNDDSNCSWSCLTSTTSETTSEFWKTFWKPLEIFAAATPYNKPLSVHFSLDEQTKICLTLDLLRTSHGADRTQRPLDHRKKSGFFIYLTLSNRKGNILPIPGYSEFLPIPPLLITTGHKI